MGTGLSDEDMKTFLIVATHPDDEVLGCGGLMAKYAAGHNDVHVLVVTRGISELFPEDKIEETRGEMRAAHTLLGVHQTYFLDFPAPDLDTIALRRVADAIRVVTQELKPHEVYIPHHGDLHADHRITHQACLVACRPTGGWVVRRIAAYETLSETDWAPPRIDQAFVPTIYEDITPYLELKIVSMQCYRSQLHSMPMNRSIESLQALARIRGGSVGVQYAEAFQLLREQR